MFLLFLLYTCYITSFLVSGCVFTAPKNKKTGIWDTRNYPRKIWTKGGGCSCGTYDPSTTDPSSSKTWLLYVYSHNTPGYPDDKRLCTGTILTSNLVAVSHTCLTQIDGDRDRKIQIYETWRPPPKFTFGELSVVTPDKIILSTHLDTANGSVYHVKDIILSTRYAHSMQASDASEIQDDMALLVTQDNLYEKGHNSVCLPSSSVLDAHKHEKLEDLLRRRLGFYYDSTAEFTNTPTGGAEAKTELQKLVILRASDCDKEAGIQERSSETTLCVRYLGNSLPGYTLGGPLVTYSPGSGASFLVGMAQEVNIKPKNNGSWYIYSYFTNVLSLVGYIDMHANKVKSEWCKATDFKLGHKVEINSVGTYPWESGSFVRKEVLDCTCGIRNSQQNTSKAEARIAGGVEATKYEFPWMVLVEAKFNDDGPYVCGASVINDRIILTAAHCIVDQLRLATDVNVQINIHYREKDDPNKKDWEVSNIYYHPDYVKEGVQKAESPGDIAVIALRHPIEFSKLRKPGGQGDYRPICLNSNSKDNSVKSPNPGDIATVAGWGLTDPKNPDSLASELQKLDVPILPRSKCHEQFSWVSNNSFCAGYFNAYKDNSKGDSGGPLFIPDKSHYAQWGGQLHQVGIVSYGSNINDNDQEDLNIYTNVQKYLDFIDYYSEREGARWCKQP